MQRTLTGQNVSDRATLKTMPPHAGKFVLFRSRLLERLLQEIDEEPLTAIIARTGFGKTSFLVQLRRELLSRGGNVAWLSVDAADSAANFIPVLVTSLRVAIGVEVPVRSLDQMGQTDADLSVASELLVRIHELARPTYLLLDDLHLLTDQHAIHFVHYLVSNAPPNFHLLIASRVEPPFAVEDWAAYGLYRRLVTEDLRFRLDDTIAFLRKRFGDDFDIELCAHLHERTEGWPLALQIITTAINKNSDIASTVAELSGATGDIASYLSRFVLGNLAPAEVTMLVRSSILTALNPELCALLGDMSDCRGTLSALEQNTGLIVSVEGGENIYRMHPLLKDYLLNRNQELPEQELKNSHRIAAQWYAAHHQLEEAADHAFQAGMRNQAMNWIEKRLRYLGVKGRIVEVLAWLDRLPPEEVARREGIQLTAAWACTLRFRLKDAERLTEVILARSGVTPETVLQVNIVRSAIAIHHDDYDRAWRCIQSHDHTLGSLYCNSLSFIAIHTGHPERARYYQQMSDGRGEIPRSFYDSMYGAFAVGLSYLVEGRATEAEQVFRKALARAEVNTGRRSLPAAMQAAGLAAACWELGAEDEARSLLANRLDLIEQAALPDAVILAYLTLARYENRMRREGKALDALNSLAEIGRLRNQPRLIAMSLAEQIRQHAIRNRHLTCRMLMNGLDTLLRQEGVRIHGLEAELQLIRELAAARVALVDFNQNAATEALEKATQIAEQLRRGRDLISIQILRACCSPGPDHASQRLFAEALGLAESFGLVRVMADDWPAAIDYLPQPGASDSAKALRVSSKFIENAIRHCQSAAMPESGVRGQVNPKSRVTHLSEREREILDAVANGRSNKEIAKLLNVGPETIKWHLKNLFLKLKAANRRHAVDRARLLGIIE